MSDKILEYIQKHVTEWPEDSSNVWLDDDGEIMFDTNNDADFYPDEKFEGVFIPDIGCTSESKSYTREEWECVTDEN